MASGQKQQTDKTKKTVVDYITDVAKQVEKDTIIRMIGNVVFHHNGAIIQCDSAYRYDDKRMDCFGNVIINQDSTYIYGDKATYDGNIDLAVVYAPLIKLTSGTETVMYTYAMTFNTLTSVGEFSKGGIVSQRDNFMEADRGIFDANTNVITLYDSVALRNLDYCIKTDSLKFNLDTEVTTFLTDTYIWDKEKDFLTSKSGTYDRKIQTYTFTEQAYLLTEDQEVWADSIIYRSLTREALLRHNAQILDSAQKTLAFGDWAYYNDSTKFAILSKLPSVRSWEEKGDTTYMRADSIFFETHPLGSTKPQPEDSTATEAVDDSLRKLQLAGIPIMENVSRPVLDSLGEPLLDSLGAPLMEIVSQPKLDSLGRPMMQPIPQELQPVGIPIMESVSRPILDSLGEPLLDSLGAPLMEIVNQPKLDSLGRPMIQPIPKPGLDSLSKPSPDSLSKPLPDSLSKPSPDSLSKPVKENLTKSAVRKASKKRAKSKSKRRQDTVIVPEPVVVEPKDSIVTTDTITMTRDSLMITQAETVDTLVVIKPKFELKARLDSLGKQQIDSLGAPIFDTIPIPEAKKDTVERLLRAFRNVRTFNKDFQSASDSLVGYSIDSTMSMFGAPVLWNEGNQITSDQMDFYSKNEQMDWADFVGSPFVVQKIDTAHYNQAKGRTMKAYFKDNEMDFTRIVGNVMNYYYRQDEDTKEIVEFATIESAEMEMYFKKREPSKMKWIGSATWAIYPMDQIPSTQPQRMDGFHWVTQGRAASPSDICIRTERPSMRTKFMGYTKPTFSIEKAINHYKESIIESGIWYERSDKPLYTADYFIENDESLQPGSPSEE